MAAHIDFVPKWVRISLAIFALVNVAYGIACYFKPGLLFENDLTGIDLAGHSAKMASYLFAARNLAIGLALLIVSQKGVPESIAIVTIIRALVELQTIIISITTGHFGAGVIVAAVILVFEIFVIKTMLGAVAKRDAQN